MTANSFAEPNLQSLLEKIARDENYIKPRFSVTNTTKPGENFVGRIFLAEIFETSETQSAKTLSLIFKVSSTNEALKSKISSTCLFRTESNVYQIILPRLNNLLKKYDVEDTNSFPGTARCFGAEVHAKTSEGLCDVIVMENKKVQNFAVLDIKKGFDLVQSRLVLEKLAIFHATSMAASILEPDLTETLKEALADGFWTSGDTKILDDLKRGLRNGLALLKEPYKKGNPVYERLCQFYEKFNTEFPQLHEPSEDLLCISHGDAWTNNMLFKISADGLATEDVCLIDWQTTTYCSPVIDISRVLFSCTTKELRDEHLESLLQFYFDEVTRVLRSFGCDAEKIFPWSKFQTHLRLYSIVGIATSILGIPLTMVYDSEVKTDVHSAEGAEFNFFDETADIKDPENLEMISKKLTDIVIDAAQWGFI